MVHRWLVTPYLQLNTGQSHHYMYLHDSHAIVHVCIYTCIYVYVCVCALIHVSALMYVYSTITSWTKEKEADAFKNMLEKVR